MPSKSTFKIIVAGDGGVGKTTLLYRYVEDRFSYDTKMTIGVEFFLKELMIDDQKVLLQLWDFGGQERFRFLLKSYVIGARGALLMFDLTRAMTLEKIPQWVNICRKENPNLPILFLGSKADLADDINISKDYIMAYKEQFNLYDYLEVSSKTGKNVESSFVSITREILKSRTKL